MSSNWHPASDILPLWERVKATRPEASQLIQAVTDRISQRSPNAWNEISAIDACLRRDTYLIKYGLPVAELAGWPDRIDAVLVDGLTGHFLWCLCWRRLDSVLDSRTIKADDIAQLVVAVARATEFHMEIVLRSKLPGLDEAIHLLKNTCEVAQEEHLAPLPLERIWERASPLLVVPLDIFGLGAEEEQIYCKYLNIAGLLHDIHDLVDDLESGIHSLPSAWLKEIDPDRVFRPDVLQKWFRRAEVELSQAIAQVRMKLSDWDAKILNVLLDDADEYRKEITLSVSNG